MKKTYSLDEFSSALGDISKEIMQEMQDSVKHEVHKLRDDMQEESESIINEYPQGSIERHFAKDVSKSWEVQDLGKKGVVVGNTSKKAHLFETGSRGGIKIKPTNQLQRGVNSMIETPFDSALYKENRGKNG